MSNNSAYDPLYVREAVHVSVDVWCGISALRELIGGEIVKQGFHLAQAAPIKLIMDLPQGYALHELETLKPSNRPNWHLIVITFSNCAEYWEDLWDLQPSGLLVTNKHSFDLASTLLRASRGEKYRITPDLISGLNRTERQALRYIARGYPNKTIAQQLGLQEKTVMNTLTNVYNKLNVRCRSEAILHYWGLQSTAETIRDVPTIPSQPTRKSDMLDQSQLWDISPARNGYFSLTND